MKPSIMLLVLLTGAAALMLEGSLRASSWEFWAIMLGLMLTGGCANGLNQYFERDLDAQMGRTKNRRPLATGALEPRPALLFIVLCGIGAILIFGLLFNWLSAFTAFATIAFYSFYYTLWLKPRTHLNIVIGGAAGAMAPVIAWAAATGSVSLTPWLLFLIVFFWTPPHFWALALCVKKDYERVKIPMMPVIKGDHETRRQILAYTLALVVISLLLHAGWLYMTAAVALGAVFLYKAWQLLKRHEQNSAWGLFKYSIVYLTALFVIIMADVAIGK
ncbi:MAG: protoheme IX farnesyltransferase [Calditrichaeota bacterium]|nr:protoheme IX farnesyltransferase [Calditrichota bacterium]MCB9365797.1 protoheme IX farnesyltransferase [Calditrichota bacterium]